MRSILTAAAIAGFTLAGCGGPKTPPYTDAAKARVALATALDAWKRGATIDELKATSPPILVRDPDWSAGAKLTAYEIAAEDGRMGTDLMVTVKLNLIRADGKAQEKRVPFTVGIGSQTVVFRYE